MPEFCRIGSVDLDLQSAALEIGAEKGRIAFDLFRIVPIVCGDPEIQRLTA